MGGMAIKVEALRLVVVHGYQGSSFEVSCCSHTLDALGHRRILVSIAGHSTDFIQDKNNNAQWPKPPWAV